MTAPLLQCIRLDATPYNCQPHCLLDGDGDGDGDNDGDGDDDGDGDGDGDGDCVDGDGVGDGDGGGPKTARHPSKHEAKRAGSVSVHCDS